MAMPELPNNRVPEGMDELTMPADTGGWDKAADFISSALERCECPIKALNQTLIAAEEIFVNVCSYAYPEGRQGTVTIGCRAQTGEAELCFIDDGTPYDPLGKPDPDTALSADERGLGGLGIFMTKKLMDSVAYRYEDGRNIFTMIKRWQA